MSNKAIIFDWNGTLLEDAAYSLAATNAALSALDVAPVSMETFRAHYTIPLSKTYKAFGCSDEQVQDKDGTLTSSFFAHYESHVGAATLREGTEAVLTYLKNCNIKNAILSNYTVSKITAQAQRFGIYSLLDDILANGDDPATPFHVGGKGDWLATYIKQHNIETAIVVGDTVEEIEIANDLGLISVAITGGTCSRERLEEARPHFLVDDIATLIGVSQQVMAC